MSTLKYFIALVTAFFLTACSSINTFDNKSQDKSSTPAASSNVLDNAIFYKDGRQAFISRCESSNLSKCFQEAGNICKTNGYEILEKTSHKEKSLLFSDKEIIEIYFVCKKPENPASK